MTDDFLHKEGNKLVKALPIYLGAQVITLLMTFLDFQVYMEAYQIHHNMTVSGWIAVWFLLVTFGLMIGISLLFSKTWKMVFSERERYKLVAGYLLGTITGLLTLGLRFMPVMPSQYFYFVGGLVLLLIIAYTVWIKRHSQFDEIFP